MKPWAVRCRGGDGGEMGLVAAAADGGLLRFKVRTAILDFGTFWGRDGSCTVRSSGGGTRQGHWRCWISAYLIVSSYLLLGYSSIQGVHFDVAQTPSCRRASYPPTTTTTTKSSPIGPPSLSSSGHNRHPQAMASKYAFTKSLREVRFLFCQTSDHSAAVRFVAPPSLHPSSSQFNERGKRG